MIIVSILIFITLSIVALIHAYWAFGGHWPGHDEQSLVRSVVGTKGLTTMPPFWLTMIVVPLIFIAGLFPLFWIGILPWFLPSILLSLGMFVVTSVFLLRGLFSYTPMARNMGFEEPFNTLDKKYYAPLCLVIGAGFTFLLLAEGGLWA